MATRDFPTQSLVGDRVRLIRDVGGGQDQTTLADKSRVEQLLGEGYKIDISQQQQPATSPADVRQEALQAEPTTSGTDVGSILSQAGIATSELPSLQSQIDELNQAQAGVAETEQSRADRLRGIISGNFDEAINRREELGEKQIGGAEARLATARGLGASSSRMQFIQSMRGEIEDDIRGLEKDRANALTNLDIESAKRAEERIDKLRTQRFQLREQAFGEAMTMLRENRAQKGFESEQQQVLRQNALGQLQNISQVGGEIPPELKSTIETQLGFGEGFTDLYVQAQESAAQAEGEQAQLKASLDIVNTLAKVPEDMEVTIGDSKYTGLKEIDPKKGLFVTTEEDRFGNVTQVTTRFNPETQEMEIVGTLDFGRIGKGFKGRSGGGGGGGGSLSGNIIPEGGGLSFEDFARDYFPNASESDLQAYLADPRLSDQVRQEYDLYLKNQEPSLIIKAVNELSPTKQDTLRLKMADEDLDFDIPSDIEEYYRRRREGSSPQSQSGLTPDELAEARAIGMTADEYTQAFK